MPSKNVTTDLPRLPFRNRKTWRRWLARHHPEAAGLWLVFYKKSSGKPSVSYAEAVEEALCFGWIDTTVKALDEQRYMQLFTPRKPKSTWSRSNKERIERLVAAGLMTPAGLAKMDEAKRNGSWTSIDSVEALEVPPDFRKALAANKRARENFEKFGTWRKKQLLYRINSAKRPATRRKRIEVTVAMAAENRT